MRRSTFGNIAASLSPSNHEGAIIISNREAVHIRSRLQWMCNDQLCRELVQALKWVEENTTAEAQKIAGRTK
jgi:hypothetical protein